MKKLFSKTVAALLSVTCMGGMTASFNGKPLFTPRLIADAEESPCVSFDEETGVLTLYGNIENMFSLANYSGDKRVKEVKALKGTVLPVDCNKLFSRFEAEKIDISNADTSHVTNMSDMFSCCSNLKYLNIDNIDTSNVTNMNQTFYACPNLKSINLQSFNTSNVTDMMNMFNRKRQPNSAIKTRKGTFLRAILIWKLYLYRAKPSGISPFSGFLKPSMQGKIRILYL